MRKYPPYAIHVGHRDRHELNLPVHVRHSTCVASPGPAAPVQLSALVGHAQHVQLPSGLAQPGPVPAQRRQACRCSQNVIDNRITAARIAAQLRWSRLKFKWIAGAYQVFCRDGGTSGQPGLPDASGIAKAGTGLRGCDGCGRGADEGHRVRGRLVLEGDAWLVVGSPPRVLMMIRLLASAATVGSPSIAALSPGTSV